MNLAIFNSLFGALPGAVYDLDNALQQRNEFGGLLLTRLPQISKVLGSNICSDT